ncbi:MAG: TIGR03905 family TSCPD domain-containing protein [Bacteroidales bacterium]|nr:TIGR03905 family TSCPD domain-containing protein [Bacteroidales bacterium]
MKYTYNTSGTCSRTINIEIENDKVVDVKFVGGCSGNLQGIGALVKGLTPEEVIARLEGIQCGMKGTSCPDQLAQALKEIRK